MKTPEAIARDERPAQVESLRRQETELSAQLNALVKKRQAIEAQLSREACPFKAGEAVEWFTTFGVRRVGTVVDGAMVGADPILSVKDNTGEKDIIWQIHRPRKLEAGKRIERAAQGKGEK